MITEEEARKKWCPMGGIGSHDNPKLPSGSACIASECAAWRGKAFEIYTNTDAELGEKGWERKRIAGREVWWREIPEDMRTGYCGLAGKP